MLGDTCRRNWQALGKRAVGTLNKQQWTSDKRWAFSFENRRGSNESYTAKDKRIIKCYLRTKLHNEYLHNL